jgi:hypothetical protein
MQGGPPAGVLRDLEAAVLRGCSTQGDWPAQVAAGIYSGVAFAISRPAVVEALTVQGSADSDSQSGYDGTISRLAGFIQVNAPKGSRLPGATDEALVAGIVGLVGDHLRLGRVDRLEQLRPELVLLALLPYLGFAEAQDWSNRVARDFGRGEI